VKNLGDGLMVVFDSASDAINCAVAMQQGADLDNRRHDHRIEIRVGISGGEATHEEDDYFGDPVVEAARLCATCSGGEIRAALVVQLTAGRRSRHTCRPLGPIALKGLSEPLETVAVEWDPIVDQPVARIPLPDRIPPTAEDVVGRGEELATLSAAFDRVRARLGREVVVVSGEAGLGKTTLLGAAARGAAAAGATVLFGHCEEDIVAPYQLFREAVTHLITHAPEAMLVDHVAEHGSALVSVAPVLASRIRDLPDTVSRDPETERFVLFSAVIGLLAHASTTGPLVIVFDDLQWADTGSLSLLRHLATSAALPAVLVLGSYRDSELGQSPALLETLAALHRLERVGRIELTGLTDDAVVSLYASVVDHDLDGAAVALAHTIARETDGNPFFVRELIRHLAETAASTRGPDVPGGDGGPLRLPDSVRDVITARVGRLGGPAVRLLTTAAVIGRDFDLALLAAGAEQNEDDLLDTLDAAAVASLVRERGTGVYSFAHALIQHTLYQDLGATRRARTHRRLALALEQLTESRPDTRVAELARHWANTGDRADNPKAITYEYRAGQAALAALAPAEALRHFEIARAHAASTDDLDPVLLLDLTIGLGTAQRQTGDPEFRATLLDAARHALARGDTKHLVTAALANNRGWTSTVGAIDREKVAILEALLPLLAPDDPDRAIVLAMLCAELSYGSALTRRSELADEAIAIANAHGTDTTVVLVSNYVSFALAVPSRLAESAPRTSDALERATRLGDPVLRYHAAVARSADAGRIGDLEEVDRCQAIRGSIAEQLDQPGLRWTNAVNRCWRAQYAGDPAEAERFAGIALQIGTDGGEPDAGVFFGVQLMMVELQRGNLGGLIPLIEQTVADNPGLPGFRAKLAMAYVECDQCDAAAALLEQFATNGYELPEDVSWLSAMCDYAEAAIRCNDPRYAAPLYEILAPWSDQVSTIGGVTVDGPVAHFLGGLATVLERVDAAEVHLARSAELCDRMTARYFGARTDLARAELRLRRPDPDGDAQLTLERVLETAHEAGYGTITRRARAALDRRPAP